MNLFLRPGFYKTYSGHYHQYLGIARCSETLAPFHIHRDVKENYFKHCSDNTMLTHISGYVACEDEHGKALQKKFLQMDRIFPVNAPREIELGIYEHYKKKQYEVLGVSLENPVGDKFVLYRAMYGEYDLWLRPLPMFKAMVQGEDGLWRMRFTKIVSKEKKKNGAFYFASFLV